MIGIDDADWEPLADGIPGFGSLEDVVPLDVMRVAKAGGQWIFAEEVQAEYMLQAKAREWKPGAVARWLRMAVRVPVGGAISRGDSLVLAAYPLGRRWHGDARFKPANHKGAAADRERKSHPGAEERAFTSEAAMHEWIDALEHDLWEKGKFLTAGVSRPGVEIKAKNQASGRKTFGVISGRLDAVVTELFAHESLVEIVGMASRGMLSCAPKDAIKAGVSPDIALHGEVTERAASLMGEAIIRALAGPTTMESAGWLDRPVWKLADRIFRNLVYEENRKRGAVTARESATAFDDEYDAESWRD